MNTIFFLRGGRTAVPAAPQPQAKTVRLRPATLRAVWRVHPRTGKLECRWTREADDGESCSRPLLRAA